MAISVYDEQFLNDEQRKRLRAFTDAWNEANARGDQAGMEAAHAAAERVRAEANYSGTRDGSGYVGFDAAGGGGQSAGNGGAWSGGQNAGSGVYSPAQLPGYRAGVREVNDLYDAARERKLAQLKTAFDQSVEALRAERAELPGVYDSQKNAAAAQSEQAGRSFNEYAAASGLNSGTAGQAALARSNQLQGDLTALGQQEAAEQADIARRETQLRTQYADDVAAAVAQGEYDRAAALLEEYRRAETSRVDTAREQANENYRAWQAGVSAAQTAEKARRETVQTQAEAESASRKEALERAARLAEAGDFSGYLALGYSRAETEAMRQAWIAKNPAAAYRVGLITWEEYSRMTGK